jgi:predicted GH43/DUF377 family glycosyl hydrolase
MKSQTTDRAAITDDGCNPNVDLGFRVQRSDVVIAPDSSKVVIRPLEEGDAAAQRKLIQRVLDLTAECTEHLLTDILAKFQGRHPDFGGVLLERYRQVTKRLGIETKDLSESKRLLIGGYFLSEYSLESAALFNPSIVAHPNQSGVPATCRRVIISLRATGEGHISSIEFRSGLIDSQGNLTIDPAADCVSAAQRCTNPAYKKSIFKQHLKEMNLTHEVADKILGLLRNTFSHEELEAAINQQREATGEWCNVDELVSQELRFLADCNYMIEFPTATPISQHVIFPQSPSDRQGIEDARFVRFTDEGISENIYYATYTAWNGSVTLPQILETHDFSEFRLSTLNGKAATNKGMAIFPRKINGKYATLARSDGINHYLSYSDDVYHWSEAELLAKPKYPWELLKVGNCGSPIETSEGWLVITHGVGSMRRYCMGAMLLDLDDPSRIIGRLKYPLLEPNENERVGYVPNVVYSCGSIVHDDWLIIPYAMSDYAVTSAKVNLSDLLTVLKSSN